MLKHQDEYLELLDKKFGVKCNPRRAHYSHGKIPDRGILVELRQLSTTRIFISDEPKNYYHKWATKLNSSHLPACVWLTSESDSSLCLDKGFFI